MAACGFGSQAVVLLRLCVYSNSAHLCRSLYPTGSPNIRDESSTQRLAGVLGRFEDPTFPLVALHQEVTAATLYCAGADLSDVDVSLDSAISRQLGLPFRLGGAGLRDPATIRKAAYLSANRSAAQYAASDGTIAPDAGYDAGCWRARETALRTSAGAGNALFWMALPPGRRVTLRRRDRTRRWPSSTYGGSLCPPIAPIPGLPLLMTSHSTHSPGTPRNARVLAMG